MKQGSSILVVGGGLTGCLTALALRRDHPQATITLWEKNRFLGGVCRSWTTGHDVLTMFPDPNPLAKSLGLSVPVEPLDVLYEIHPPSGRPVVFRTGLGPGGFLDTLTARFPEEAWALQRFWDACLALETQFFRLKSRWGLDLVSFLVRCGPLLKALGQTWRKWLAGFGFRDPALILALEGLSKVANLGADELSAPVAVLALVGLVRNAVRPAPGFASWLDGLAEVLPARGVEVRLGRRLVSLSRGARLVAKSVEGEHEFDVVVSTIDSMQLRACVDPRLKNQWARPHRRCTAMSPSFLLWRGVFEAEFVQPPGQILGWTPSGRPWALTLRPGPRPGTSFGDVLLVPEDGARWSRLATRPEDYRAALNALEDELLREIPVALDRPLPPLAGREWFTPPGFSAAFGTTEGSQYDLSCVPRQAGACRPGFATGIPGLWQLKLLHGVLGAFFQAEVFADLFSGGRNHGYRYPISY